VSSRDLDYRLNSALTAEQVEMLEDEKILVTLIFNSQTGLVEEIYLGFGNLLPYNPSARSIPAYRA
jgi:hypothetical protein